MGDLFGGSLLGVIYMYEYCQLCAQDIGDANIIKFIRHDGYKSEFRVCSECFDLYMTLVHMIYLNLLYVLTDKCRKETEHGQ